MTIKLYEDEYGSMYVHPECRINNDNPCHGPFDVEASRIRSGKGHVNSCKVCSKCLVHEFDEYGVCFECDAVK